jgi:hypothetical protein
MYRVKFLDLREQTKEQFDYENIFDALRVAKETNLGSERVIREAIPDKEFNEQLHLLLTSGFVYAGWKTSEYPTGDHMVFLLKVDANNNESPVYSMPFFAMPPVAEELPIVPKTNTISELYVSMQLIKPENETPVDEAWVDTFINSEQPKIHRSEPGAGNYS